MSRRGIILPAKRNPFIYPGRRPGIDYGHFAIRPYGGTYSPLVESSIVALSSNNYMTSMVTGLRGATTGSQAVGAIDPTLGPCIVFTSAGQGQRFTSNRYPAYDGVRPFTVAGILRYTSNGVFWASLDNGGTSLNTCTFELTAFQINSLGGTITSGLSITAGCWFMACSCANPGTASPTGNFVTTDLATGKIQAKSAVGTGPAAASGSAAGYLIGGQLSNGAMLGRFHAFAWIEQALSLQDLVRWAQDPWTFWYPQQLDLADMMMPSLGFPSSTLPFMGVG